jgi:leader peptidase (prepilin peptidase)/N-methyltransferase
MLLVVLFVLGLCVGSFLNVAIWRLPLGGSVVRPPSHCPACGALLRRRDLIPVASWILLGRRCRTCGVSISARYPVVELTTAVLFVAMGLRFGPSWALPAYLTFGAVAVVLAGIDLDTMTLPRRIVYGGGIAGAALLALAAVASGQPSRLVDAAIGAAGAVAFLLALHLVSPRGMGFGDVRFAGLVGLHLGWLGLTEVPTGLFLGFALGAIVGVGWLALGGAAWRRTRIPFGPFLAAGALVTVVWGEPLAALWLRG